ncbi:hypothetical protein AB0425_12870 [Actinosynnema sp. NPDC051121]|nr:hypothetical protein [Saccharothrix sp.]
MRVHPERSFEEDQRPTALHEVPLPGLAGGAIAGFPVSGRSAEEHIAEILQPVGPLVAVGAPGARLRAGSPVLLQRGRGANQVSRRAGRAAASPAA